MKKTFLILSIALLSLTACNRTPDLEPGGAYAPAITNSTTNTDGTVSTNVIATAAPEKVLYITDAAYKFAYNTGLGVFKFEYDNREEIKLISPEVKPALDKMRTVFNDVNRRWAMARKSYKENPTPAGLTAIQTILAELDRMLPTLQAELEPYFKSLTKPLPVVQQTS